MPAPVVFSLGLLQDFLSFAALGTGVLTLLILHGVALRARDFLVRQSFLLAWVMFSALAAGVVALGWCLQAMLSLQLPPLAPGLHQFGVAVGIYPAMAWILARLHTSMRRAETAL